MKVIMLVLVVSAFALSSTFAVAKTVSHKPRLRNSYGLQRMGMPLVRSRSLYPNYDYGGSYGYGGASGGTLSNGRSASEAGGG
jgi:hypothetical protein